MSENGHNGSRLRAGSGDRMPPTDSHGDCQELCAYFAMGELSDEEWARLSRHLTACQKCREAIDQYKRVVGEVIPALAAETRFLPRRDGPEPDAPGSWSIDAAEAALMESIGNEAAHRAPALVSAPRTSRWKHVRRCAIAASILLACGFLGYRIGVLRETHSDAAVRPGASVPSQSLSDAQPVATVVPAQTGKTAPPNDQITERMADQIAALRNELRSSQLEVASLKGRLAQASDQIANRQASLDRSLQDRMELGRELADTKANAETLETKLSQIGTQSARDTRDLLVLKTQVADLNTEIEQKDKLVEAERKLLDRDRDVRNLIGARNLYIAEVYDVAKTGDTQKPFGRVFYTKDQSLIFYGYDLDQQPGVKQANTFQAWGSRGADRAHAVSLGLLYQDDVSQKRWALKLKDPKTISEIDAVFVTVEPQGGSTRPSGKPLLFTSLHIDPNHP